MINGNLSGLAPLIYQLALYQLLDDRGDGESNRPLPEKTKEQVAGWLKIASIVTSDFEIKAADDRISIIQKFLAKGMTWGQLSIESRVLQETITAGLKNQLIYRYPTEQASVLMRWQKDWKTVRAKFPSTEPDIRGAVDCWALGHGTAAVFHSMRILEYGIAALAKNVGRDPGMQNWQNLIDQIESEIRSLGKTLPAGIEKSERLRFLSEAAKEMVYFKDGWRNYVSHNRATYDQYQARSVIEHTRSFMMALSEKLGEPGPTGESS